MGRGSVGEWECDLVQWCTVLVRAGLECFAAVLRGRAGDGLGCGVVVCCSVVAFGFMMWVRCGVVGGA